MQGWPRQYRRSGRFAHVLRGWIFSVDPNSTPPRKTLPVDQLSVPISQSNSRRLVLLSTSQQSNELQKKAAEHDEECNPSDAHEGNFSAKPVAGRRPKHINARPPDELENVTRSVRQIPQLAEQGHLLVR